MLRLRWLLVDPAISIVATTGSSNATKCSSEGTCMIAWHADDSSVFVHKKDQGEATGPGLKSRSWRMARGTGSSQLGFGLGTASRNWKCMLQQGFSSICGANNHGVNACNIASRSVLLLDSKGTRFFQSTFAALLHSIGHPGLTLSFGSGASS